MCSKNVNYYIVHFKVNILGLSNRPWGVDMSK